MFGRRDKDEDNWSSFSKGEDNWGSYGSSNNNNNFNSHNNFDDERKISTKAKVIVSIIGVLIIVVVVYFSITGITDKNKKLVEQEKQEKVLELAKQELKKGQEIDIDSYKRELDSDYQKKLDAYIEENNNNDKITNNTYNEILERYNKDRKSDLKELTSVATVIYKGKTPLPLYQFEDTDTMFAIDKNEISAIIVNSNFLKSDKDLMDNDFKVILGDNYNKLSTDYNDLTYGDYTVYSKEGIDYIDLQD